ncbi:DUF7489 domain-containing protein [Nocardioides ultimimeridianus]
MKRRWEGTVVRKSRGLLDGSNLYRRLTIRQADGRLVKVRVSRARWDAVRVGDHLTEED